MIWYNTIVIAIKYLFQFPFWGSWNFPTFICQQSVLQSACFTFPYIVGIDRFSEIDFMTFLVPDILLLFFLFVHKTSSKVLGIWT